MQRDTFGTLESTIRSRINTDSENTSFVALDPF